jgi:hypothetical protein
VRERVELGSVPRGGMVCADLLRLRFGAPQSTKHLVVEIKSWSSVRLNEYGLSIKSYWLGDEAVCIWEPEG